VSCREQAVAQELKTQPWDSSVAMIFFVEWDPIPMEEGPQSEDLAEEINQQYPMDLSGQELNGGWISTEVGQKHDQGEWHGNCL